jgi:hypothetical protein
MCYVPFCPPRNGGDKSKSKIIKDKKGLIMYNENLGTIPMSKLSL